MFARYSSIHRVVITCAAVLTGALQFLVAQTNTAVGTGALSSNTTGTYNTAFGVTALNRNTTGFHNTANGAQALYYNTTGNYNTAFGVNALHNNISGGFNTSNGTYSLFNNTTGNHNVSTGYAALYLNTTGNNNVSTGHAALYHNTTGSNNAVYGFFAGTYQADGSTPLIPNNSIYIGASSRGYSNSDSNSIVIGYQAIGEGANTTVIGNSSTTTAHIYGTLVVSGLTVGGQSVLTQAAAAATYLTSANAASTYLPKASFDPNGDGKIDTAQMTGVAPLAITNSTASTSSTTGALVISGGLGVAKDAYINGMRVGLGAGSNGSNTVLGNGALNVNTTGDGIVAVGSSSLASNTTGAWNTAVGFQSLAANTTGYWNMAVGFQSLFSNTTGAANSAAGFGALSSNTTGFHNTANGYYALRLNTTGAYNTANGSRALYSNTTGTGNIAFGVDAGNFQADGVTALTTVNNSVYLGTGSRGFDNADNNAIVIGYQAIGEGANTTVIGNAQTTSAHIYGQLNVSSLNVAGQPVLTQAAVAAGYQPIDTDLASIAALTTTTYGQSLLTGADAAATRSNLGLGTLATQNGTITDYLTTATAATTYQPLDADLSSIANLSTTAFGRGILTAADAAAARSMLGVGAGGGTGTGDVIGPAASVANRLAVFSGTSGKTIKDSGETVMASAPYTLSQTWNAGDITFTGIQSNITDTASATGSLLLDLQVDGFSKFSVDKGGNIAASNITISGQPVLTQAAANSTYLTAATAATTYLSKSTFDPNGDGKIDTAQITGVAPLSVTNTTAATSSTTGALVVFGGLGVAKDANIHGLTVGLGGGNVAGNTAIGINALLANTTGGSNTATGWSALAANTTGSWNTAYGLNGLAANTTGGANTAQGFQALGSNTTGSDNTATGAYALVYNSTGINNTATGSAALFFNTTGDWNTASGRSALQLNTTGYYNVATGGNALVANTTGISNTADGTSALYSNTTGNSNTATGQGALRGNTIGSGNTAVGVEAGRYLPNGATELISANNSVYIGAQSRGFDNNDNNSIVIGYQAIGEGANTTVIGNSSTTSAHIYGQLNVSSLNVAGQPVLTQAAIAAGYQPIDADLASIAALSTTTYGQSLLTGADAAATRTNLGLGTLATQNGTLSDYLTTATAATTYQPLDADLTSIAAQSTTAFGRGLLSVSDAAAARTLIGVGTGVGSGDVAGPAASVGNRLAVFDSTTGKILKDSGETVTTSQPYTIAQTWDDGEADVVFTGIQSNITDTGSAAGSKLIDLQVGGVSKFNVDKEGNTVTKQIIITTPAGGIDMGEFGNP